MCIRDSICVIMAAPVFSSDYASGADDILRCSRYGRGRLAAAKTGSALLIGSGVFALCLGAFLVVVYLAFGFDDITSAELLQVAFNPRGLDAMGVLGWIVLSAALSFLATCSFSLFVSSRFKSPLAALALSAALVLIPTVIRMSMAVSYTHLNTQPAASQKRGQCNSVFCTHHHAA